MAIFFGWIIGSFIAGIIGSDRKCGFFMPFFLSLILSPLVGFIIALSSTKNSTIEFQKKMLEAQQRPSEQSQRVVEDSNREEYYREIGKLEGLLEAGKITAIEYEERKDKLRNWYLRG